MNAIATVQILIDLKNADPTALTAGEAIRTLLGHGDHLRDLRRRELLEIVVRSPEERAPSLIDRVTEYMERTVVLWNSNKHRAWVRILGPIPGTEGVPEPWEAGHGRKRASAFGAPGLDAPDYDHVMVWSRGGGAPAPDLAAALGPWQVAAAGRCELYSLQWRASGTEDERMARTTSVAVARSRGEGLLVNPHFQDHRVLTGAVPLPLWGG